MAERAKLKEADEILNSIGAKKRKKKPAILQSDSMSPPIAQEDNDRNPLDFGKYTLSPKPVNTADAMAGNSALTESKDANVPFKKSNKPILSSPEATKKEVAPFEFESFGRDPAAPDAPMEGRSPKQSPPQLTLIEKEQAAVSDFAAHSSGSDETQQEADRFLQSFTQQTIEQENLGEKSFRETLAEKFMRERVKYLKDLGIDPDAQPLKAKGPEKAASTTAPAAPQSPRRKLDFQIQPEMHRSAEEKPAAETPVTYNRSARVQPIKPEPARAQPAPLPQETAPDSAKTAAQLVLELAEQSKGRTFRKKPVFEPAIPDQFTFQLAGEEDAVQAQVRQKPQKENRRRWTRAKKPRSKHSWMFKRTIILSAMAGVVLLSLAGWAVHSFVLPDKEIADGEVILASEPGDVYTAYENFIATSTASYKNVIVKRSGVTLGNLDIAESLVVEEEATAEGALTLHNVTVGDLIYIKSSGVNLIELDNVTTQRLVINNENSPVTLRFGGNSDIGAVEMRTNTLIEQGTLQPDAPGIRNLTAKNTTNTSALNVRLKGAMLPSLNTFGETVAEFENASVENMASDGNLSLTGSGRVQTLSAGINTGEGAGDVMSPKPLNILIKGVQLTHLNVKSPANINISTQVDNVFAADSLNLGGNGSVGSIVFNEKFGNPRLAVDISGVHIQQLITNAEALIYSSGSSSINMLTANQSTYALGNKVNLLVANADGVIYEQEPDAKRIGQGIAPPQSKADNPNLNYNMALLENGMEPAAKIQGDDPVATSCDHAREVGAFTSGDGSKDNPFVVETPAQLAHVSQHPTAHFVQKSDIDIADDSAFVSGFPAIGSSGARFSGVYDGGGFSIRNLRIAGSGENVGLFAENTGIIRNLHIRSGEIIGVKQSFTGAIVGFNYQGGQITGCSNGASINAGDSAYAGGIVGYNYGGKVRDCYNTAKISGGDSVGGIAGMNRQNASITGSYNAGTVEAALTAGSVAGSNEDAVVTNCYYLTETAEQGIGSGAGNTVEVTAQQLSSAQMAADLAAGNDDSPWKQSEDASYGYPVLKN